MNKIKHVLFWFVFLGLLSFANISSFALPDAPNISSNTSGNMANGGRVLKYDGWVYYSFDSYGLYRMKEDGSQKEKLHTGWYWNLTAYDGYIYGYCVHTGTNNQEGVGLYRMKPDGTDKVRVSSQYMEFITIYDGWIYYISLDDHCKPHNWNVNEPNIMNSGITPDIVVKDDSDYMKEVERLIP